MTTLWNAMPFLVLGLLALAWIIGAWAWSRRASAAEGQRAQARRDLLVAAAGPAKPVTGGNGARAIDAAAAGPIAHAVLPWALLFIAGTLPVFRAGCRHGMVLGLVRAGGPDAAVLMVA